MSSQDSDKHWQMLQVNELPDKLKKFIGCDGLRFNPAPDLGDQTSVVKFVEAQRAQSEANRRLGDMWRDEGAQDQAVLVWALASQQNHRAIEAARQYLCAQGVVDDRGGWPRGRNDSLTTPLSEILQAYCDSLGRQGGLLRRLGHPLGAHGYYALGATIEQVGGERAGFENSYNTMNSITTMIEAGERSASPISPRLSNLAKEILQARDMIKRQIFGTTPPTEGVGTRHSKGWAWADLGLAIILSDDRSEIASSVPEYFLQFAGRAEAEDIDASLNVMRLLKSALEKMDDPVYEALEAGIDILRRQALASGIKV